MHQQKSKLLQLQANTFLQLHGCSLFEKLCYLWRRFSQQVGSFKKGRCNDNKLLCQRWKACQLLCDVNLESGSSDLEGLITFFLCSLLCRTFDAGLAECCHHEKIGLLAYSPLAMGLLTVCNLQSILSLHELSCILHDNNPDLRAIHAYCKSYAFQVELDCTYPLLVSMISAQQACRQKEQETVPF